jgi:protein-L-isoaspartate(D-aspartate) O-methyltransferase
VDFSRERKILADSLRSGIVDERVLQAIGRVPRELFVPQELKELAYEDRPQLIGHGQTISQPFIVALMTQALELHGKERVLEVGTGSGYQAAILAELAGLVFTIERIPDLSEQAACLLGKLGYQNIIFGIAGDELGWSAHAPYDAIIVTAASPVLLQSLIQQLNIGGRLVIPVGSRWEQELLKVTRLKSGDRVEKLGGCRFVPLIARDAWQE